MGYKGEKGGGREVPEGDEELRAPFIPGAVTKPTPVRGRYPINQLDMIPSLIALTRFHFPGTLDSYFHPG